MPSTVEETEASVKRAKTADTRLMEECCILHELPVPVLDKVLVEYLDILSLVQLAGCNPKWRQTVYDSTEDPPELWNVIDFHEVAATDSARITDTQLGALLRNCHAQTRCRILKLTGCVQIRGSGLVELEGSCALREIDLRLSLSNESQGRPDIDTSIIFPVLSSMPPFVRVDANERLPRNSLGLSRVKFSPHYPERNNFYDKFQTDISDWLSSFNDALGLEAQRKNISCGYCERVIAEVLSPEEMTWMPIMLYCEVCQKITCVSGSCPDTRECGECFMQCCQPMGPGTKWQCPTHTMIFDCKQCERQLCEACFDGDLCFVCCEEYCQACESVCELCACMEVFCPKCVDEHQQTCAAHKEEEMKDDAGEEVDDNERTGWKQWPMMSRSNFLGL